MHEHEHNKLDEIFREGLAQGNFPYNPDSWNQLTPALDRLATRRRWLNMRVTSVAVLGLFLIAALLLKNNTVLYPKADYPRESIKKVSPENAEKPINPQLKSTPPAATTPAEVKAIPSTNDSTATEGKVDAARVQEKNSIRPHSRQKTPPRKTLPIHPAKEAQPVPHPSTSHYASNHLRRNTTSTSIYRSNTDTNSPTTQYDPSTSVYQEHPTDFNTAIIPDVSSLLNPLIRPRHTLIIPHSSQFIDLNTQSVLPTRTKIQRLPGQHRFIVSLDLNSGLTVPSTFENTGTALGLGVRAGYRIGHNTRIYIGTTWTTLRFQIEDEEAFQPPSDFWKIPGEIEETKGTFSLLEIPVDLEISWNIGPKKYVFAGIGAASTILFNQTYTFEFEEDQPGEPLFWESADVIKYLAGYAQIQAGVAQALGSRGTIRIAPFLQVPLTRMGIGQVHIFRFGLGLQIQPF